MLYSNRLAVALIEIIANDRLGQKVRVKCDSEDTVGDLKKLIAAQTGTKAEKIVLKKWYTIYKDQLSPFLSTKRLMSFGTDVPLSTRSKASHWPTTRSVSIRVCRPFLLTADPVSFPGHPHQINDGMSLEMQ